MDKISSMALPQKIGAPNRVTESGVTWRKPANLESEISPDRDMTPLFSALRDKPKNAPFTPDGGNIGRHCFQRIVEITDSKVTAKRSKQWVDDHGGDTIIPFSADMERKVPFCACRSTHVCCVRACVPRARV